MITYLLCLYLLSLWLVFLWHKAKSVDYCVNIFLVAIKCHIIPSMCVIFYLSIFITPWIIKLSNITHFWITLCMISYYILVHCIIKNFSYCIIFLFVKVHSKKDFPHSTESIKTTTSINYNLDWRSFMSWSKIFIFKTS